VKLIKYLSWDHIVGTRVEIRQNGQLIRIGTVEAVMPDSSIVWLASDGVQPRAMYEAALHYEVWAGAQPVADLF
jgi:hypothetical protein